MSPGVTSVLLSVSGVLIGGAITWFFAKRYYEKASRDLDRAADELRGETKRVRGRLVDLFAALDEAGLIEVEWNKTGDDIKGVVIRRQFFTQANVSRAEGELDTERARREMADSTLREGMAEEQRRREEDPKRAEPRPNAPGAQEGVQRPWWRRVFGD